MLLYPQYRYVLRDGEDGGGFWQQVINYFGSCGEGGGGASANFRAIIPPTVDTKIPEAGAEAAAQPEKQGEPPKEILIDRKPSKPFYYVLPPSPEFNYYFPQPDLFKPQAIPPNSIQTYILSSSFRKSPLNYITPEIDIRQSKAKSINVQIDRQDDEKNADNSSDLKFSNGHANEKNVN